jgi:hypothetical protein
MRTFLRTIRFIVILPFAVISIIFYLLSVIFCVFSEWTGWIFDIIPNKINSPIYDFFTRKINRMYVKKHPNDTVPTMIKYLKKNKLS